MKKTRMPLGLRAQVALLIIGAAALFVLSFMPNTRAALSSSETRFTEISAHGLGITPASCESGANYYHVGLVLTGDGYGYESVPDYSSAGAYAPYAGEYVCVINGSGAYVFIPARSAGELNTFKAYHPGGIVAY